MIDYIMNFFSRNLIDLVGKGVMIFIVSLIMYISFYYANRRNIRWLTYIEFGAIVVAFAISFLGISNGKFYLEMFVIALLVVNIVLFSGEISRDLFKRAWAVNIKSINTGNISRQALDDTADAIVRACQNMSKADIGALILIADDISPSVLESGTKMGATVTSELLETVFWPKTPLHDGAVVVTATNIVAAGCYLPLTQNIYLPREFGTRHRAAIGITDASPAITAIVVSEESGIISAFHDGRIKRYLDADELRTILKLALHLLPQDQKDKIWGGK